MKVSDNGRYLIGGERRPFFYCADTCWNLFYHATLNEAKEYLSKRKEQGFTVVMPCILREGGIDNAVTRDGYRPFVNNDPSQPDETFFRHVDAVVTMAADMGFVIALLPTWGEYILLKRGKGPVIFGEANARVYGEYIAGRYRNFPIIWVMGADRNIEGGEITVFRAMAEGVRKAKHEGQLMTFHPSRGRSSTWFHTDDWLDFNMMQTSTMWDFDNYNWVLDDYCLLPVKPTLDGEVRYEYSHEVFYQKPPCGRRVTAHQVRKAAYNAILSGACGHTYGCRDVWDFYDPVQPPTRDESMHWRAAMDLPGAVQVGLHLTSLFAAYPWYKLVPDQTKKVVVHGNGDKGTYIPAAIAEDSSFILAYVPECMPVWVDITTVSGMRVKASWFNPRNGEYVSIGIFEKNAMQKFEPPESEHDSDYVLVLESAM